MNNFWVDRPTFVTGATGLVGSWLVKRLVEANHTIAIPAGVPHAFVAVGPSPVRMFTFMPRNRAIAEATTYFEGEPPAGADQH